ncbi:hypothetical protein E4U43_000654, partial [Claviceps pusilla]
RQCARSRGLAPMPTRPTSRCHVLLRVERRCRNQTMPRTTTHQPIRQCRRSELARNFQHV